MSEIIYWEFMLSIQSVWDTLAPVIQPPKMRRLLTSRPCLLIEFKMLEFGWGLAKMITSSELILGEVKAVPLSIWFSSGWFSILAFILIAFHINTFSSLTEMSAGV